MVEQWVLQSNDPSQPALQWQAAMHLQDWTTRASPSQVFDIVCQILLAAEQQSSTFTNTTCSGTSPADPLTPLTTTTATTTNGTTTTVQKQGVVQFYALTVAGQLLPLWTPYERWQLRQFLLHGSSNNNNNNNAAPSYMRNKRAAVISSLILWGSWEEEDGVSSGSKEENDFYHLVQVDLIQHLSVQQPVLFLKTVETVLEDVLQLDSIFASHENNNNTNNSNGSSDLQVNNNEPPSRRRRRVKEYLKGYDNQSSNNGSSSSEVGIHGGTNRTSTSLLRLLFDRTVQLLEQALVQQQQQHQLNHSGCGDDEQFLHLALMTLWRFFQWMDLLQYHQNGGSTTAALLLPLLVQCLARPCCSADVHVAVLQVWQEWSASATADDKWPHVSGLLEQIHRSNLLPREEESTADIVVVIQLAKLVNAAGLELLSQNSTSGKHDAVWHQVLDLFFRAFNYDDIDVSTAVLPLAAQLASRMDSNGMDSNLCQQQQHLPAILHILYRQLQYPPDFRYDYTDENDAEEIVYRAELAKLFTKLVRVAPDYCLQFCCQVAAFLRLLYHYCEGIRPPPGLKSVMQNATFCAVLTALLSSDIGAHPHAAVLGLYYDVAVRYYPIYQTEPLLLPRILANMSSGLQHASETVRSRCCYLLLRLVKSVAKLLRPFVETAVSGIHEFLASARSSLRPDDMLYLFETVGLLLGRTGLDAVDQQRYLTQVMTPHVRSIEDRLASSSLDPEEDGLVLSSSVAALAHLSKGFSKPPEQVKLVLVETIQITLTVLEALPGSAAVRNKAMVLFQRMILCVGSMVLPQVQRYLYLLIDHCTDEDILFVSQLMNQICIKFKVEAVPVLDGALLPFLRKCQRLLPENEVLSDVGNGHGATAPPHLPTEQLSLQKLTFVVLQHIVSYSVTPILVSPTNLGSLESILQTMSDGALYVPDPIVKKTCIKFFRDLLEEWAVTATCPSDGSSNNNEQQQQQQEVYQRGLLVFLIQHLIPGMFVCLFRRDFDELDATHSRVVQEFAHVLFAIQTLSSSCHNNSTSTNTTKNDASSLLLYEQCIANGVAAAAQLPPHDPRVVGLRPAAKSPLQVQAWLAALLEQVKRGG
jgi:hypothetical protein